MAGKLLGDITPVSPLDYEAEDDASSVQSSLSQQVCRFPQQCHLWTLHPNRETWTCRKARDSSYEGAYVHFWRTGTERCRFGCTCEADGNWPC